MFMKNELTLRILFFSWLHSGHLVVSFSVCNKLKGVLSYSFSSSYEELNCLWWSTVEKYRSAIKNCKGNYDIWQLQWFKIFVKTSVSYIKPEFMLYMAPQKSNWLREIFHGTGCTLQWIPNALSNRYYVHTV